MMKIQNINMTNLDGNVAQIKHKVQLPAQASEMDSSRASPSFTDRLTDGLKDVANAQNTATKLAKDYEFGAENDLSKVMVTQQVSSLGFQLTLNLRNKALSAYKDIMNMPV